MTDEITIGNNKKRKIKRNEKIVLINYSIGFIKRPCCLSGRIGSKTFRFNIIIKFFLEIYIFSNSLILTGLTILIHFHSSQMLLFYILQKLNSSKMI